MVRLSVVALVVALAGCSGGSPVGRAELNGQGATFVEPIMSTWANYYLDEITQGNVRINYQGTGSGAGIQQFTNRTCDFACSDAPMNQKQLDAAVPVWPVIHVPLVIGAVVPVYNLPGVEKALNFTGPLLAEIYLGKVTKWNDPTVAAINPGVALPDLGIQPVFRSDSSGTTNVFTEYLSKVSPAYKAAIGTNTTTATAPKVGIGKPKTNGVAGHVASTPGAVGYVELTYALDKKSQYGAVKNAAGTFVRADLASITAAAASALATKPTEPPYSLNDMTYSLTEQSGDAAYPIAAMSYAVVSGSPPDPAKGKAVVAFLAWCVGPDGQKMAELRNFAALPPELAKRAADKLASVGK